MYINVRENPRGNIWAHRATADKTYKHNKGRRQTKHINTTQGVGRQNI